MSTLFQAINKDADLPKLYVNQRPSASTLIETFMRENEGKETTKKLQEYVPEEKETEDMTIQKKLKMILEAEKSETEVERRRMAGVPRAAEMVGLTTTERQEYAEAMEKAKAEFLAKIGK